MVEKEARKFGLSPEVTRRALAEGYELHRQVIDEIPDAQKLITDLNKTGTAELTQGERAIADSKRLSQATLDHLQGRIEEQGPEGTLAQAMEGRGGADIINRLMEDGVVTQQEKPRLLNADGSLTAEGKGRVSRLMVARLFEDAQQLEAAAPELKQKLERVVTPLARVAGRDEWDITPQVREAVRLVEEARRRDASVDDLVEQRGLFGTGEYSEEAAAIARKLQAKPTEVARAFRQYAKEADLAREEQPMLGMEPPAQAESFREAFAGKGKPNGLLDRIDAAGKAASERLRARGVASGASVSMNEFLNPQTIRDMAASIAGDVARGALKLEDLGARLAKEYGPKARLMAQKVWNEVQNILRPVGADEFAAHGPVFRGYWGDEAGATKKLQEVRAGEAPGALYDHRRSHAIDLVWHYAGDGPPEWEHGGGLAHIEAKHPKMLGKLQQTIDAANSPAGKVEDSWGTRRVYIAPNGDTVSVDAQRFGVHKRWVVTAVDEARTRPPAAEGTVGVSDTLGRAVGTTTPTPGGPSSGIARPGADVNRFQAMVARGAQLVSEGRKGFTGWKQAMQQEFPDAKPGELMQVWPRAQKRNRQRGSITLLPGRPAETQPSGAGGKPVTTAAAAPGPEQPGLTTSPSYDKTRHKILEKADVPEAERAELARRMEEWEAEHTERRTVTFEDIRAEARALDPRLVLQLKRPKSGETMNPALRYAAREMLNGINEQIFRRRKELAAKQETADPAWTLDEERRIGELEKQARGLLDVLIPTRSQDGRNLAYHRMMAEQSFDTEYWIARAKRAAGGSLDAASQMEIRQVLAEGREAEAAAAERARERRTAGTSRVQAGPPTSEQRVERGVQRKLQSIERQASGEERQPGPWALTPEERAEVANDPRVRAARIELARKMMRVERTGVLDTIVALRRAGLLTGVKTHLRNVGGNLAFQVLEETARIPAAVVDAGMEMFSGRRTVSGPDPAAVAKASYAAATRGVREAREIMRTGSTEEQLAKMDMRKEVNSGSRVLDAHANTVFRTMGAEDRVFKVYAYERSLQEQMKLAGVGEATEAMRAQAIADAEFSTFNNPNVMAQGLRTMQGQMKASGAAGRVTAFGIDMAVPFANTSANILARVMDYSGGGVVKAGYHAAKAAMDRAITPEQQRAIATNLGRGLTGPALIYMGWKLSEAGLMTGTRPDEQGAAGREEAAGRPAGAVLAGGRWWQIAPFSPVGNLLTIGATLQRESTRTLKDEAKRPANLAKVATRTVMEQPMLKGMQEIAEGLMEPGKRMERAAGSMGGSFVPTLVSDAAGLADSKRRETGGETTLEAMANSVKSRMPGLRNTLPARVDALGKSEDQLWTQAFDPTLSKPARELKDPVLREMVQEQVGLSKAQKRQGEGDEEFRLRQIITGRVIEGHMRALVDSTAYQDLPGIKSGDESRKLLLEKAIHQARTEVNRLVSHPEFKAKTPKERAEFLRTIVQPD